MMIILVPLLASEGMKGAEDRTFDRPFLSFIPNVLFLTSDNEFSGIIFNQFRDRQNIFLIIFST